MDPETTIKNLLDALRSGDFDAAREAYDALEGWAAHGGFIPDAPRLAARVERLEGLLREAGRELHRVGGCEGFEDGSTGETHPHSDPCDRMSRGWSEK